MGLNYKGGGFLPGVPARPLSEDEVEQHGRVALIASGLYEEKQAEQPKANKRAGPPSENKAADGGEEA